MCCIAMYAINRRLGLGLARHSQTEFCIRVYFSSCLDVVHVVARDPVMWVRTLSAWNV